MRRRTLIRGALGLLASGIAGFAYAAGIEPGLRLRVQEWRVPMPGWGTRPPMTVAVLTDIHAGEPHMPLSRIEAIVDRANALRPDLTVVLGDLPAHHPYVWRRVAVWDVARTLAGLRAPLGVHAILGNHDWWDDETAQVTGRGPPAIRRWLEAVGLNVLANRAVRLPHGDGVWLAGLDSQWAYWLGRWRHRGADDLPGTTAQLGDDAPAILLAHEPDIFPHVPSRFALTLCGHTHAGQLRLFGWSPFVPSIYGNRYAYGLVEEEGRFLVASAGLGCSVAPVRFGAPPEITLVHLGA
ncbi:metallophosphoesterase [Roseomonas sp. CCTCC AB2023176]|uniref:metallophosphoesterase n=1 Tax=Roseomonas sp. CCTCC AB2023176 TaxID=3342640 RepID=UPI0035DEDA33